MKYPLTDISEVESTKERIILTAAIMFAERGYSAVSVRDIAERVKIKPASLYTHFKSKEALFETIIDTIESVYLDFYNRMDQALKNVTCFADVLGCLFSELKSVYHMFVYYGVSLLAVEQFSNQRARESFNTVYMKIGIEYSTKVFNECIEKNWVKAFDARTLATIFMNSVFVGSLMRTHEDMNHPPVYDVTEMFTALQKFMQSSVEVIK